MSDNADNLIDAIPNRNLKAIACKLLPEFYDTDEIGYTDKRYESGKFWSESSDTIRQIIVREGLAEQVISALKISLGKYPDSNQTVFTGGRTRIKPFVGDAYRRTTRNTTTVYHGDLLDGVDGFLTRSDYLHIKPTIYKKVMPDLNDTDDMDWCMRL